MTGESISVGYAAPLRRTPLVAAVAALVGAGSAAGSFQPVRHDGPRFRTGTIAILAGRPDGRVRVIVRLEEPPLAAAAWRRLQAAGAARRLDVRTRSARAYLAHLARLQGAAAVALRRAIPEARVQERFRIVLDGLAVSLPARRLPALARLRFVTRIFASRSYTLATNRSPHLIGADELAAATGARGDGVKIAVVDDGIDAKNPFFDAAGFAYPAGFPKGDTAYTTPKVIVARVFPGPNAGRTGRLPLDPAASFHGTHVAGIAAGDAGTRAPAGSDHPAASGLSGVAPRAWLGSYRVFTVPTPIGRSADTPEVVAAFEAAVADGMDVINFSGGGAESEPSTDPLIEAIHNVAAAGVVPVVAAGNDRDDFGMGTIGSPGVAPDAITVAAVSNDHVFGPTLSATSAGAPASARRIPYQPDDNALRSGVVTLVDVGSLGVDPFLCGPAADPNGASSPLPRRSLDGAVALVRRGGCTFASKARRAQLAGAAGLLVADNRRGEANAIPERLSIPAAMVSDLDGSSLRAYLAGQGGRAPIRVGTQIEEVLTGRGGVIASFSSAGPLAFGHRLKPDLAAPGGQILSSTLPHAGGPFAVLDGTSMAAPHIAGAAALLRELHPGWTVAQLKSALVSTAAPAYADTARTAEAPVLEEGGGLASLTRARDPRLFTDPVSLSFGDLDVNHAAASRELLLRLTDAGGGAGTWTVGLAPQSASAGTHVALAGLVTIPPGGEVALPVQADAAVDAPAGDDYGFVVLTRDGVTRRVPYGFFVERPALESVAAVPLGRTQRGSTVAGESRVSRYRWPDAPFGPSSSYTGPAMREDGAETLYSLRIDRPAANAGVAVVSQPRGARVEPFFLLGKDENAVAGQAGTPVDVNNLSAGFKDDVGAAGVELPRAQTYYVAVDAPRDPFTGKLLGGSFTLRSWIDDVTPPTVRLLTTHVSAGRPTIVLRATDAGSGVDPASLTIGYGGMLVDAAEYDPVTGLAVVPLPRGAPALAAGTTRTRIRVSDFQETKNVDTSGPSIFPNTRFARAQLMVVEGPTLTWLQARCSLLLVAAASTKPVQAVRFFANGRAIAVVRKARYGLYRAAWRGGRATVRAVVVDASGRSAAAETHFLRDSAACRGSR